MLDIYGIKMKFLYVEDGEKKFSQNLRHQLV